MEWTNGLDRERGILLRNGGNGPAFNVKGEVRFVEGTVRQIIESTLAAGDTELCRLDGPIPVHEQWVEAVGSVEYRDLTTTNRGTDFHFHDAEGRLFVRVQQVTYDEPISIPQGPLRAGVRQPEPTYSVGPIVAQTPGNRLTQPCALAAWMYPQIRMAREARPPQGNKGR
jgi:hypothetical protein